MVPDSPENRSKCICPTCPSYPSTCQGEVLYCATGASRCDIAAKGCDCPACPVYFENQLTGIYFCDKVPIKATKNVMRKKGSSEEPEWYQDIAKIKELAITGQSSVESMGSRKKMPFSWSDLHFVPAQVAQIPLNREELVKTEVVIGPAAQKPLRVFSPILISGMSYGATSKPVKLVIAAVAKALGMGFNSGEGGILETDLAARDFLIGQYATGRFGVDEKLLRSVAAVEIRFGQGAYPGKGSYLPASKMTPEVAKIRGLKGGEAAYSPAHHHDMTSPSEIKTKVDWLRKLTGGVPIGAKIGCGNIEADLEVLLAAGVDFITLDGFGGGTGATDAYVRENVGLPLIAALPRAVQFLKKAQARQRISLIASGSLRFAPDFAKCLALGADAIYIGTAALIAINCEQYRICHTGLCPTGVTTHNPVLTTQLKVEEGVRKLTNFIKISTEEIANLTRIVGKNEVTKLSSDDLVALPRDLADLTGVRWLDGPPQSARVA